MHTLSGFVNRLQSLRGAAWRAGLQRPARPVPARRSAVEPTALRDDAGVADQLALGCGWFDSSHALQCGLRVTEHASPDALAITLPLDAWLELHLAGRLPACAVRAD